MRTLKPAVRWGRSGWVVFFVAAGVLGFELSLMRVLLVASWHHFAFLVISIVLLGFGASGTALSLFRTRLLPHGEGVLFALVLATATSMPVCLGVAQHVPIEARFVPALMWRQIAFWILYWSLLGIPFFVGAGAIGLALMTAGQNVGRVYAANLLGSAAGLMLATAAMSLTPPQWLPLWMGGLVLGGGVGSQPTFLRRRIVATVVCVGVVAALCVTDPPHIRLDPYKYGAYVRRLERQDQAKRVAAAYGPRAVVEAYSSELFHDLPFLSVGMAPPAMMTLLADGHAAGSVLEITRPEDAEVMDFCLMAFPYDLAPANPGVLLLGEGGGTNVWLAARHRAEAIHVVQPDANLVSLLHGPVRDHGGSVLDLPAVHLVTTEPRHFVEHTGERFDLIQFVTLESSAAGSGGVRGLAEDHLITVEGIGAAFRRLTDDGLLVATRGIQTPPRDNFKLLATFAAALRRDGVARPAHHVVVVRDYLAVCTIAKTTPWTPQQIERVRRACAERELTPIWFPGIRPDEINRPDVMDGPPDEQGDWYHYAATRLLSPTPERFIADWPFDIRPPTDDRPFFLDFCKVARLDELKRAFGDLWLTRTELAFPFVLAAIAVVGIAGAVLTIVPLLLVREYRYAGGLGSILAYFAAIGLGYMLLEMTFLSRLTHWVGDPISAAAVTIGGFLLSSGLGSLSAQKYRGKPTRLIRAVVVGLILIGLLELMVIPALAGAVGSLPYPARCGSAFGAVLPLGYLMGFPMPTGLARLDRAAPATIPWAWGINGFASVIATPTAIAIGMSVGYTTAGGVALAMYVVPGLLFARLPRKT
ncbi:MAG: hypothetical protein JSU86_00365 [Phycisphaerales bacterium]|nr:MAG: hypothetical protein JSU86_00365 [Phycisphaerales bacterium]